MTPDIAQETRQDSPNSPPRLLLTFRLPQKTNASKNTQLSLLQQELNQLFECLGMLTDQSEINLPCLEHIPNGGSSTFRR